VLHRPILSRVYDQSWPSGLGGRGLSRLTATLVEEVFG